MVPKPLRKRRRKSDSRWCTTRLNTVAQNQVTLSGQIIERSPQRYTPAGVPVSEAVLQHSGEVIESGMSRQLGFSIALRALGDAARWLEAAELGKDVEVRGFLAARSLKSRQLVLHVHALTFI